MTDPKHSSELAGHVPNNSEAFGIVPQNAEGFRNVLKVSERKDNHTLTVREVARMFESAGVARTERSIINWCQPNRQGVPRLDCYFDPNERRYFISLQSVELAIKEEQAKAVKGIQASDELSVPKHSETRTDTVTKDDVDDQKDLKALHQELMDLKITNRGKDFFIEQLQKEREGFSLERKDYIEKLMAFNRKVGELESRLLQLDAPAIITSQKADLQGDDASDVER